MRSAIPSVSAQDTDDIRWALETASTLWEQGDHREALRWVRRAAEAAAEAGADNRALELAKSGAELRRAAEMPRTMPPPDGASAGAGESQSPKPSESQAPRASGELVVTVAARDDAAPAPGSSFVGHRAMRVAISPSPGHEGEFVVRPLKAGEVAPRDSAVGLLVALEPGEAPLPPGDEG